jgi:nicotinate-nucleotide pyrophosphorylase (carboxylating)
VEVEIGSHLEAVEALVAGADIIMYDNMSPEDIRSSLELLKEEGYREGKIFEASGGITDENIEEYAFSGVDILSVGFLTHSVKSLDVKLDVELL